MAIWLPNADTVAAIHEKLTNLFAEEADPISPPGVKDRGLLESACMRPETGLGNVQKYKTVFEKGAALFHSLAKNHAFHNGNKRTAIVTLLTYLNRNDKALGEGVTDDALYAFCLDVTADRFPDKKTGLSPDTAVMAISRWIDERHISSQVAFPTMKVSEFLDRCRDHGCQVRQSGKGGAWLVSNPGEGSIRISQATPQIHGPVVRTFLQRLGLTASRAGVQKVDFLGEFGEEREQIRRFISTLRRLAKT